MTVADHAAVQLTNQPARNAIAADDKPAGMAAMDRAVAQRPHETACTEGEACTDRFEWLAPILVSKP